MKIIATIADAANPDGWEHTYFAPYITTHEEGERHAARYVGLLNANLRSGEPARRLVSVRTEKLTTEDAYSLGYKGWADITDVNPFPEGPLHDAWNEGLEQALTDHPDALADHPGAH